MRFKIDPHIGDRENLVLPDISRSCELWIDRPLALTSSINGGGRYLNLMNIGLGNLGSYIKVGQ